MPTEHEKVAMKLSHTNIWDFSKVNGFLWAQHEIPFCFQILSLEVEHTVLSIKAKIDFLGEKCHSMFNVFKFTS